MRSVVEIMDLASHHEGRHQRANLFTKDDVVRILEERGWLAGDRSPEQLAWCERAAALLGHFVESREGLAALLQQVFSYDAKLILAQVDSHAVMGRYAARDVIRHLALLMLEPVPFTSDRFKEVLTRLKEGLELRGRDLFFPIRLALAGRAGEGEMDRVILLADEAAALRFAVPVKNMHDRIIEFCAELD